MIIVIVERDPIVRIDMEETLKAAFEGATVSSVSTADEIDDISADILITDSPLQRQNLATWLAQGAQIISTGAQDQNASGSRIDGVVQLSRPFSSEMLLQMVKQVSNHA